MFKLHGQQWKVGYGINDEKGSSLSYQEIIKKLHPKIHWYYEQDDDYQGDFFVAGYDKRNHWFFIQGSFGSCSGCDWLESIDTEEEAIKFLNHFKKEIIEKPSKKAIIKYMLETSLNVSWSKDTLKKLVIVVQKSRGYRPKRSVEAKNIIQEKSK